MIKINWFGKPNEDEFKVEVKPEPLPTNSELFAEALEKTENEFKAKALRKYFIDLVYGADVVKETEEARQHYLSEYYGTGKSANSTKKELEEKYPLARISILADRYSEGVRIAFSVDLTTEKIIDKLAEM